MRPCVQSTQHSDKSYFRHRSLIRKDINSDPQMVVPEDSSFDLLCIVMKAKEFPSSLRVSHWISASYGAAPAAAEAY